MFDRVKLLDKLVIVSQLYEQYILKQTRSDYLRTMHKFIDASIRKPTTDYRRNLWPYRLSIPF